MNPIIFESNTTNFSTNGLGRLTDCISCVVQEVINGIYELEMVYPISGVHYSLIQEYRILYAPHDDTKQKQPFEIYRISKPINGKVTVNAWHINHRLRKMVCLPFNATSASSALSILGSNSITGENPFTFISSGISTAGTIQQKTPIEIKTIMGGMQGSIIDTFGGEWEYDHFTCTLKNRRGTDTDVSIRYGKNLKDIKKVTDTSNLWTGIIPYWSGSENGSDITVYYPSVIRTPAYNNFPYGMVIAVDASSDFEQKPQQSDLHTWGVNYIAANAQSIIPATIDVSFIELWQTEEYKDIAALQELSIGDSVHVYYNELGVDNTARIVSYKYNVLLERYDSMTLGSVKATFTSSVQKNIDSVESAIKKMPTKSFIERQIDHQTQLITGGLGGHIVMKLNSDGEPEEFLAMDQADVETAQKVLRLNMLGIGFSTNGYDGPFDTAWTIDGDFNAKYITAGTMLADRIRGGTLILGGVESDTAFGAGELHLYDATQPTPNLIVKMDSNGLYMTKGQININNKFIVTDTGVLTCNDATINGTVNANTSEAWVSLKDAHLIGGVYAYSSSSETGYISFYQRNLTTNQYGTRIGGRGMIILATPELAIGGYASPSGHISMAYSGVTGQINYVSALNPPSGTLNTERVYVDDILNHNFDWINVPVSVTVSCTGVQKQLHFTKGIMDTSS